MGKSECEQACSSGPVPPGPPPSPPPGGDSWWNYQVGGMEVLSVTGGADRTKYERAVIVLHGGGGAGTDWIAQYDMGWFGDLAGVKYVFPSSPDRLWYHSFKNGCGLLDDCAYNLSSIQVSAARVAALIEEETRQLGGQRKQVFLAGFSEGAQLTGYMQFAKLDYALGGAVVMDGFPLPPLENMPGASPASAKRNASYYGGDMRWMIWHGGADPIFPAPLTMRTWDGIFAALGVTDTLKVRQVVPGMTHTVTQEEFAAMVKFVKE